MTDDSDVSITLQLLVSQRLIAGEIR